MFKLRLSQKNGYTLKTCEGKAINAFAVAHGLDPELHEGNDTTIHFPVRMMMTAKHTEPVIGGPFYRTCNFYVAGVAKGKYLLGVFMDVSVMDDLRGSIIKPAMKLGEINKAIRLRDDCLEDGIIPIITPQNRGFKTPHSAIFATPHTLYSIVAEATRKKILTPRMNQPTIHA